MPFGTTGFTRFDRNQRLFGRGTGDSLAVFLADIDYRPDAKRLKQFGAFGFDPQAALYWALDDMWVYKSTICLLM